MSQKLDAGWKMTDASCDKCRFTILMEPSTLKGHCMKCGEVFEGLFENIPEEKDSKRQELQSEAKKEQSKAIETKNATKNKDTQKSKNHESSEEEEVKLKPKKGKNLAAKIFLTFLSKKIKL